MGPYQILEVGSNTLLVRPVDKPAEQAIRINMERVVPCPKLPDQSWLGAKAERHRQRRSPHVAAGDPVSDCIREGGQDMNLSDYGVCESLNILCFLFCCSRGRELAQEREL